MFERTRVEIDLAVPPPAAYRAFCAVERIGEWLTHVRVLEVVARYPSGLAEQVRFEATIDRTPQPYSLRYVYDVAGLRVAWKTPSAEPMLFRGDARFVQRGDGGCTLDYRFFERSDETSLHHIAAAEERLAYARRVVAAFKEWLEA